jgi:transketolase
MQFSFTNTTFENKHRNSKEYNLIIKEIKCDIIKSLALAKSGHPGGAIGISDVMAVLFFGNNMKYDATSPNWEQRDRFVLSAGHYAPVLYSVLSRAGYFKPEELSTLRKLGSRLQGHPSSVGILPGNETTSGSLGQGISIAVGMAISDKIIDKNERKVFCLSGDGELQEGSCWEAAMSAGMYKLNNLCWIVDNNDCQIDGRVENVMSIYPLADKFIAFNFDVIEIDGNDASQVIDAFGKFKENCNNNIGKPTCIIAKTKMGNGIPLMNDNYKWHGNAPSMEQAEQALIDIEKYYQNN